MWEPLERATWTLPPPASAITAGVGPMGRPQDESCHSPLLPALCSQSPETCAHTEGQPPPFPSWPAPHLPPLLRPQSQASTTGTWAAQTHMEPKVLLTLVSIDRTHFPFFPQTLLLPSIQAPFPSTWLRYSPMHSSLRADCDGHTQCFALLSSETHTRRPKSTF